MYKRLNPTFAHIPERFVLYFCHLVHADKLEQLEDARKRRMEAIKLIAASNEDGKVALIEGGRDCDGVQYEGRVHIVGASIKDVEDQVDGINSWADGPTWFSITSPSKAEKVNFSSRDVAMEAFEDGHPHVLYT